MTYIPAATGVVDTQNSTTTPLGIGGVFTGEWVEILDGADIFVNIITDQASATDGLVVEQSSDGVNADHSDVFTINASQAENYDINPHSKFMRVKYTNGSVAQTYIRLQVIKKQMKSLESTHRIGDELTTQDDARVVKGVMAYEDTNDGTINNVSIQNPYPVDGDSLYAKDVWEQESDIGNFSGSVTDLLDNLHSTISDVTANNPKEILIHFNRTVVSNAVGLGANSGNFSNVEIQIGNSGGVFTTVVDESADNTDYTSRTYQLPVTAGFNAIKFIFHTADAVSLSNLVVLKSRSNVSRLQATKDNNEVTDIGATNNDNLRVSVQEYGDTPSVDAFARLRVSDNFTIFDSKQLHDKQPLFWDEEIGGSATSVHSSTNAETLMTVTASASDYVIRQTKQRFNYQPGKSQLVFFTLRSPQNTGVTCRSGLFDGTGVNNLTPNNGMFFECDGVLSWNIAKNGTTTETITQANWNVDPLDGTGASGITLDVDATQIGIIDYEWLGVGRVRVGFVINGLIYYCHYFNHANDDTYTSVYMSSPNLPLRYSIESDGTGGGTLQHICSTVISEGGIEETGILRSVDTGSTHVDANTANTIYAVKGIRLKSNYKDVTVTPEFFSMLNETNDDFRWSLCLNPTIAGTFTYSDVANSAVQEATGVTANTVSDEGLVIDSGYITGGVSGGADSRKFETSLRIGSKIDGTLDEIVLCVTPLTANADIQASLTFRELL